MNAALELLQGNFGGLAVGVGAFFLTLAAQHYMATAFSADEKRSYDEAEAARNAKLTPGETFLDRTRKSVKLGKIFQLSPDTFKFRFALPERNSVLGLPIGKHFKVYGPNPVGVKEGEWNGRPDKETGKAEIVRSYTPTSSDVDLGHFDLVIKVYKGGVIDRFPDGGKLSQYMGSLQPGDEVDIQGPYGLIEYLGGGEFKHKKSTFRARKIGMIAGGTGITPMLQIMEAVFRDTADTKTELSLLFGNQTEDDILLRGRLEELAAKYPGRLNLHYTLDRPPTDGSWKYSKGFVTKEMMEEHLPGPTESGGSVVLMCGPPPMVNGCKRNLTAIGFDASRQLSF